VTEAVLDYPRRTARSPRRLATLELFSSGLSEIVEGTRREPLRYYAIQFLKDVRVETDVDVERFEVIKPIETHVVSLSHDDFVATAVDMRISASGETPELAVEMLKDMIVGRYEHLNSHPIERLGKEPRRQLSALRSYIRERK
jgi:hypothetical protein